MSEDTNILYALTTCRHCKSTRELLSLYDIDHECIEVDTLTGEDRQTTLEDLKKLNPKCSFPTLRINGSVIVGFKKAKIQEAIGVNED